MITVPSRWSINSTTQVCISLTDDTKFTNEDSIHAIITTVTRGKYDFKIVSVQDLQLTTGEFLFQSLKYSFILG